MELEWGERDGTSSNWTSASTSIETTIDLISPRTYNKHRLLGNIQQHSTQRMAEKLMNSMNTWILIPRYIALRTALYGAPKNETSARDQPNPIRRLVDGVGVGSRTRSNLITCRCCVFLEYATVQTRAWLTSLLYTSRTAQIPFVSPPPIGQRSIVMSVSVCVCVFVCPRS